LSFDQQHSHHEGDQDGGKARKGLLAFEQHFTPGELGALWNLAPSKVRELFANEPGVIKLGEPSRREGRTLKRRYYTLRIPETVALRVHKGLTSWPSRSRRA
jgi:hypothetical protein